MGITIKDIFLKVLLRVKEMNLIVWHRLAFEELANDLIADLKEVGNDRIAINELFHMVKKAQTAGQESSLELYERGLQEITSDGTNLKILINARSKQDIYRAIPVVMNIIDNMIRPYKPSMKI